MKHEVLLRTSDGRRSVLIDDAFCQSLSVPVGENCETVSLFIASWLALLADSPLDPDNKPFAVYKRFLEDIRRQGIKATVVGFTNLAHELVSRHTLMGAGSSIGDWIDGFKDTPVFFEYNRYYKTGDVTILRFLYTFLNFGKKLEYVDEAFNESAFRGWCDVEKRLDDLELDCTDTSALRQILGAVLPPFSWTDVRPKFGPGSVQERGVKGRLDKLSRLQFDPLIDRFLLHGHIGMYGQGKELGICAENIIPDVTAWTPARCVSSRNSRLMFVPKNLKVARSICMEPNTLMYFQQACLREIVGIIDRSVLSNFIDLADQQRNKDLSLAGSYTSEIDTLDLSAASDSLSYDLVKKVFPPSWRIMMAATRSHCVILPDGSLRSVKKYAPMGSALCFPTQCLIFASVCIYAACLYTYEVENVDIAFLEWLKPSVINRVISLFVETPGYYGRYFQPLAIYGDDICVDRRLTDIVKSILLRLGFEVNVTKSFTGSQAFRESCGGYYLGGHDITPLYFTVKGTKRKLTAKSVVSQVHLINEARIRSYKTLYRFLHATLMTWGISKVGKNHNLRKNPIPYVSDPNVFGILVPTPGNSHLKGRTNQSYQREELKCWTILYTQRREPGVSLPLVDAYEYMRWWTGRGFDKTTDLGRSVSRYDTSCPGLRWRWIPAQ